MCRKAGLAEHVLHAMREVIADSIGDVAVLTDEHRGDDPVARMLIAEKLRYARRPADVFGDSLAAHVELGWLTRTTELGAAGAQQVLDCARSLVETALGFLLHGNAAACELWFEDVASAFSMASLEAPVPSDVVPAFVAPPSRATRAPRRRRQRQRQRQRQRGCVHV